MHWSLVPGYVGADQSVDDGIRRPCTLRLDEEGVADTCVRFIWKKTDEHLPQLIPWPGVSLLENDQHNEQHRSSIRLDFYANHSLPQI